MGLNFDKYNAETIGDWFVIGSGTGPIGSVIAGTGPIGSVIAGTGPICDCWYGTNRFCDWFWYAESIGSGTPLSIVDRSNILYNCSTAMSPLY